MYSAWDVRKLAAQKGFTILSKIGSATTGTRVTLSDPRGREVDCGVRGFSLARAVAYLEPLPDVPPSKRPALVPDEDAVVSAPRRVRRPPPPAR